MRKPSFNRSLATAIASRAAATLAIFFLAFHAMAAPPRTLNYQGFLTNGSGAPTSGATQVTFSLYAAPTGGAALWSETQPSVAVTQGEFSTVLGNITPLTLAFDAPYYLGITVESDPEMTPRQVLTASAYAFRAMSIDSAATVPASVLTGPITTATISGSNVTGDLTGVGNIVLPATTGNPGSVGSIIKNGQLFMHDFGVRNTFLGSQAGSLMATGTDNVAVGAGAMESNTTAGGNVAIGASALFAQSFNNSNTPYFSYNTAVGFAALAQNQPGAPLDFTGTANTAVGAVALAGNTTGADNVGVGNYALQNNNTGSNNIAVGSSALGGNTTASKNTAVGHLALATQSFSPGAPWDSWNTAVGFQALYANQPTSTSDGVFNTAVGAQSLMNNTTGASNAAVGAGALNANTTGTNNTAVGALALNSNTTGNGNVAFGERALRFNTSGSTNLAIGNNALLNNIASDNVAIGDAALNLVTTGSQNVAVGWGALFAATGNTNTALGYNAGVNIQSGNGNVDIGNPGNGADDGVMRIGSGQAKTYISGIHGIATDNPALAVFVAADGQLGTVSSSRSVKEDIADMGSASDLLMKLRPVTFHYKNRPGWPLQYGLIAEEVAEVAPDLAARGPDGNAQTVYYQDLPPMLLNEYQKQERTIEAQRARIEVLERRLSEVDSLERRLRELESRLGSAR